MNNVTAIVIFSLIFAIAGTSHAQETANFFQQVAASTTGQSASATASATASGTLDDRLDATRARLAAIQQPLTEAAEEEYEQKAKLTSLSVRQRQQSQALASIERKGQALQEQINQTQMNFINTVGGPEVVRRDPSLLAMVATIGRTRLDNAKQLGQASQVLQGNLAQLATQQARASVQISIAQAKQALDNCTSSVPVPGAIGGEPAKDQGSVSPELEAAGLKELERLFPEKAVKASPRVREHRVPAPGATKIIEMRPDDQI